MPRRRTRAIAFSERIKLGGEGGWDYVTVDSAARRVYIPRSTHILVIDADSGKQVADIQGMNGLHGVAVAPGSDNGRSGM